VGAAPEAMPSIDLIGLCNILDVKKQLKLDHEHHYA
jgi:hypothetical protein